MDSGQFRDYIIRPALFDIDENVKPPLNTPNAVQMLLVTTGIETECGHYIVQVDGPALGPYQDEPDSLDDLYWNYLRYKSANMSPTKNPQPRRLMFDFSYATKCARLQYYRHPDPMPELNDQVGMWECYKKIWNTDQGAATKAEFDQAWEQFVKPLKWDFTIPTSQRNKTRK